MFYLYNFNKSDIAAEKIDFLSIPQSCFKMETCQRHLIISTTELKSFTRECTRLQGRAAYQYLLEMICGLKSRLIAENEIVGQFRGFLNGYLASAQRDSTILRVLQKLLQDHKKIRTLHLKGISQRTYAAITKKQILEKKPQAQQVLIWGSGNLAEDLINQFKKKSEVFICARNTLRVAELKAKHPIKVIKWQDFESASQVPIQINTIGTDQEMFSYTYLNSSDLFVDLASPSPLNKKFLKEANSDKLVNLKYIFDLGAIAEKEKLEKIQHAKKEIIKISEKRMSLINERKTYRSSLQI